MNGRWKKGTEASSRKTRRKHPRDRPKIKWEDDIIWDLKEVDYEGDWKTLVQDRMTGRAYVLVAVNLRIR